jgi:hypothetical protein
MEEQSMIKIKIMAILFIFICASPEIIKFQGIKKEYKYDEKLNYSVSNLSKNNLFINIALEVNLNNKWEEAISDVTRQTINSASVYEIRHSKCKSFVFDLKKIDKALFRDKKVEIRLKVYYRNKIVKLKSIFYSDNMIIKSL